MRSPSFACSMVCSGTPRTPSAGPPWLRHRDLVEHREFHTETLEPDPMGTWRGAPIATSFLTPPTVTPEGKLPEVRTDGRAGTHPRDGRGLTTSPAPAVPWHLKLLGDGTRALPRLPASCRWAVGAIHWLTPLSLIDAARVGTRLSGPACRWLRMKTGVPRRARAGQVDAVTRRTSSGWGSAPVVPV